MSIHLTTQKIIKEWTDYNNHMNLSYYILVFDIGAEKTAQEWESYPVNMGEQHLKEIRKILDKEDPSYKS